MVQCCIICHICLKNDKACCYTVNCKSLLCVLFHFEVQPTLEGYLNINTEVQIYKQLVDTNGSRILPWRVTLACHTLV